MKRLKCTLGAIVWNDNPELLAKTERVIRHCKRHFQFDDTVLFTYREPSADMRKFAIEIPEMNYRSSMKFYLKMIYKFAECGHWMWVQYDGFPFYEAMWDDAFMQYDFIGAPWPWTMQAGNDGFSIWSYNLISTLQAKFPWHDGKTASDIWMVPQFEKFGIKAAPFHVARRFSREKRFDNCRTFGFHGAKANPSDFKYGWDIIEWEEENNKPWNDTNFTGWADEKQRLLDETTKRLARLTLDKADYKKLAYVRRLLDLTLEGAVTPAQPSALELLKQNEKELQTTTASA